MKRLLITIGLIAVIISTILCFSGCGTSPLAKAYEDLTALNEEGSYNAEYADYYDSTNSPLLLKYDEENDVLSIGVNFRADIDKIFDILYKDLNKKDIGTFILNITGSNGDEFVASINEKLGELSCSSLEMLGVDYLIMRYIQDNYGWLSLAKKTTTLYISNHNGLSTISTYSEGEIECFENITKVLLASENGKETFSSLTILNNLETIVLVDGSYYDPESVEAEEEEEDADANINDENNTEAAASEEETQAFPDFVFGNYSSGSGYFSKEDVASLASMKNLKTILIYPDTGYTMDPSGEYFIMALKCVVPEILINKPEEVYSDGKTVPVTEIENNTYAASDQAILLGDFLELEVENIFNKCKDFSESTSAPKLNDKILLYEDQPNENNWKNERAVSGPGQCYLNLIADNGLPAPKKIGDYKTFVLLYPTYVRTGSYTSGTSAYKETLHVQVFDLENKIAYKSEVLDTANAPDSFSYIGTAPKKYSGDTDSNKVVDYLKGLEKTA